MRKVPTPRDERKSSDAYLRRGHNEPQRDSHQHGQTQTGKTSTISGISRAVSYDDAAEPASNNPALSFCDGTGIAMISTRSAGGMGSAPSLRGSSSFGIGSRAISCTALTSCTSKLLLGHSSLLSPLSFQASSGKTPVCLCSSFGSVVALGVSCCGLGRPNTSSCVVRKENSDSAQGARVVVRSGQISSLGDRRGGLGIDL